MQATIQTNRGAISIQLFPEQAPLTVVNFVHLAQSGYYDGVKFHRVIENFMIQGGDPTGTGRGGPGYKFKDECVPELTFSRPGLLAMANAGPGTNGSQFFITHVPTPWLNGKHTIFGSVTEGQEVVDSIQQGDEIESIAFSGETEDLLTAHKAQVDAWKREMKKN